VYVGYVYVGYVYVGYVYVGYVYVGYVYGASRQQERAGKSAANRPPSVESNGDGDGDGGTEAAAAAPPSGDGARTTPSACFRF
jgi:hypothetical protein